MTKPYRLTRQLTYSSSELIKRVMKLDRREISEGGQRDGEVVKMILMIHVYAIRQRSKSN